MAVLLQLSKKIKNDTQPMSKKNKDINQKAEVITKKKKSAEKKQEEKKADPLDILQEELQKEKDRNLRLFAEFENFKKRTGRERIELFKTASEDVMISLLPVLDDFDRALNEIKKAKDDELFNGVELINNKLIEILKSKGLEKIETKQGDQFNADDHEAVTQIPSPSNDLKGKIVDIIECGYILGEKIIRYPKVVIGK
jgi:molecular chaperone GrpE